MSEPKVVVAHHEAGKGSLRAYTVGFVLSMALTLVAYVSVAGHVASGWTLLVVLSILAVTQLLVQLLFFLHVGHESKPRWNLTAMLFAAMVVGIITFGSLWIMKNLSYDHHAPANESDKAIIKDERIQPSSY